MLLLLSKEERMLCKISLTFVYLMHLFLIPPIQTQDSPQDYVNAHNAARTEVGVGPLSWDSVLAVYSQNYTNVRAKDCRLVHSGGPYGENLAWSSGDLVGIDAVRLWVSEKADYVYNTNACVEGRVCGHYTQVVWQQSTKLGCARVRCNNGGSLISCNYYPPGNYIGQRPYGFNDRAAPPPAPDPQDYVNAHNAARAEVGVGPLSWDSVLAVYSENYTNISAKDCRLEHSGGPYGENLAWSSSDDLLGTDAVKLWVSEKADYDYNSNTCAEGRVCGHYTQVVWQQSTKLGCARVRCNNGGSLISCNYYPPGNNVGQRPYEFNIQAAPAPAPAPAPKAFTPIYSMVPPPTSLENRRMKMGLMTSIIIGAFVVIIVILCFIRFILRLKKKRKYENDRVLDVFSRNELIENEMGARKFSYGELARATNNFGEEEKLGEGGFGAVYRGFLRNLNVYVAVKKISRRSKQGTKEYAKEIKIFSRLRHKNTVKLIGWSHEKELLLVYEFMPNGSLDSHLFKGKSLLTWTTRCKIIQGLASALLYLHEEGDQCVLHRDIKSSNIMLDSDFNAKLGDFGLARLVDHAKGSQTTALAGTMGYMAPECLTTCKASRESDIYSFGIVALEVSCGRRPIEHTYDEAQVSLVPWVWQSYGNKKLLDVADKNLGSNFDVKQLECLMIVGLWCAHPDRNLRPSIRQVIRALNFELPLPNLPCLMPVPKYEPISVPAVSSSDGEAPLSLTIPR